MKARIHVLKARMKVGMMIANEIDTSPVSFLQFGTIHVIELLTHVPELMEKRYRALPEIYCIHSKNTCHERQWELSNSVRTFASNGLSITYEENRNHREHHDGPSLADSFLGLLH